MTARSKNVPVKHGTKPVRRSAEILQAPVGWRDETHRPTTVMSYEDEALDEHMAVLGEN